MLSKVYSTLNTLTVGHYYDLVFLACLMFAMYRPRRRFALIRMLVGLVGGIIISRLIFRVVRVETDSRTVQIAIACLRYFLTYLTCLLMIVGTFRLNGWEALFIATAGYMTQHVAFVLYRTILYYAHLATDASISIFIFWGTTIAVYGLFYLIFCRRLRGLGEHLSFTNHYMILVAMTNLVVAIVMSELCVHYVLREESLASTPVLGMMTAFAIIVSFISLLDMLENIKALRIASELDTLYELERKGKYQYEQSKRNIEMLNIRYHDLKHQVDKMKMDDALRREIEQGLEQYSAVYKTGNSALDVLLAEKSTLARADGIDFLVIADGSSLEGMRTSDIYSLFGNLCDNAIEALRYVEDKEKRVVSMDVRRSEDGVLIQCQNYMAEIPKMRDGLPVTTKKDYKNHGYGLKSIGYTISKYGGSMKISTEDYIFAVTIFIPHPIHELTAITK